MKKIKIFLKAAILMAFITLILSCMIDIAYGSTSPSTIGTSNGYLYIEGIQCTSYNLSKLLLLCGDNALDLSESDLRSLYNAAVPLSTGSASAFTLNGTRYTFNNNLHNRNVMCIGHYQTTNGGSETNYYIRQIMSFYFSNGSYTLKNYYGSSSSDTQTITKSTGTNSFKVVCRLGEALFNMYTYGSDDENTTDQNQTAANLLEFAKVNGYLSFHSVFTNTNWDNSSSSSVSLSTSNSYYTDMNNYKSVTASWSSTSTRYADSRK